MLLGDFQFGTRESPALDKLVEHGVRVPDAVRLPSNVRGDRYYDLIGFVSDRPPLLGPAEPCAGTVDVFGQVLRDADLKLYSGVQAFKRHRSKLGRAGGAQAKRDYEMWRTRVISDHRPLWAELAVDAMLARAQASATGHRGCRQQDRPDLLGRTRTGRHLSCPEGSIRAPPDRRAISSLRNAVRAKVSDDDQTGPPPGKPEVVSGLKSSLD